jgi:cytochrome c551/c552
MKYLFLCLIVTAFLSCNNADQKNNADITGKGEMLFNNNCSTCHKPDEDFVGPALKDAASRWPNKALLYAFVKNPDSVIQKDIYALSLQQKYSSLMTPFPNLSSDDINAILAYCNQ